MAIPSEGERYSRQGKQTHKGGDSPQLYYHPGNGFQSYAIANSGVRDLNNLRRDYCTTKGRSLKKNFEMDKKASCSDKPRMKIAQL